MPDEASGGGMGQRGGLLDVSASEPPKAPRGTVALLHGIAQQSWSMRRLRQAFARRGWRVLNIGYRSRHAPIAALADDVAATLRALTRPGDCSSEGPLHIVGFSMGGLVARAAVARSPPEKLGRMVLIGTPTHGSEVADLLRDPGEGLKPKRQTPVRPLGRRRCAEL